MKIILGATLSILLFVISMPAYSDITIENLTARCLGVSFGAEGGLNSISVPLGQQSFPFSIPQGVTWLIVYNALSSIHGGCGKAPGPDAPYYCLDIKNGQTITVQQNNGSLNVQNTTSGQVCNSCDHTIPLCTEL